MLKLRSLCFAVILASAFLQPTPLAAAAHDSGLPAVDPAGTDGRGHRIQQIKQVTRWIVVTSIAPPNDVIRRLAALPDWRVVVVADQKTPQNWHCCNVTFLGIDEQADLGYEIVKHIPFNNYGRKNIGYLYAIKHGAEVIYETDDDNMLIVPTILQLVPTTGETSELSATVTGNSPSGNYTFLDISRTPDLPDHMGNPQGTPTNNNFNPYPLFGVPQMWPRGLPLQDIKLQQTNCFTRSPGRPLIQQGLANNDPDVDAVFRLTQPLGVEFDKQTFSVLLPPNTMTPFNSQNTLFLYDALWAMLLPVTTTMRVCDIWRGYWAQRLLWDIGGHLAFIPPTVVQHRNPHTVYKDFQEELDLYNKAGALLEDLRAWQPKNNTLQGRMVELAQLMADKGYWSHGDVELTAAWVQDLSAAGYKFPDVITLKSDIAAPAVVSQTEIRIVSSATTVAANIVPAQTTEGTTQQLQAQAATSAWSPNSFIYPQRWCRYADINLVVNFNIIELTGSRGDSADRMDMLYAAYKPWFKEVYFTGNYPDHSQSSPEAKQHSQSPDKPLNDTTNKLHANLVNCHNTNQHTMKYMPGHFAMVCLAEVMSATPAQTGIHGRLDDGFLYVNDDVTFSPCALKGLNRSKIWYDRVFVKDYASAEEFWSVHKPQAQQFLVSNVQQNKLWHFVTDFSNGRAPGRLAQHTHLAMANAYGWMADKIKTRLDDPEHTGMHIFGFWQGDYYYVPGRFAKQFVTWAHYFRRYHVFNEVAVPNILGLLGDSAADYEMVSGIMLWDDARVHAVNNIQALLPLGHDISLNIACSAAEHNLVKQGRRAWFHARRHLAERAPPCFELPAGIATQGEVLASKVVYKAANATGTSLHFLHPLKLSNTALADWWVQWWQSQRC